MALCIGQIPTMNLIRIYVAIANGISAKISKQKGLWSVEIFEIL